MLESKFLAYLLYITLLEVREAAFKTNDSRIYTLADILHNAPFALLQEHSTKVEYALLLESIKELNLGEWLNQRFIEFKKRFPEFDQQDVFQPD